MEMDKPTELEEQSSRISSQSINLGDHDASSVPVFTPPDGGPKAWLCVVGAFFAQFCSFGFLNALVGPVS